MATERIRKFPSLCSDDYDILATIPQTPSSSPPRRWAKTNAFSNLFGVKE